MLRGLYTSASGMLAREGQMNVVANNLANINTTGFKKDVAVFREFPKYLQLRLRDELFLYDKGTLDLAPEVGELGTGVTVDAIITDFQQGPMQETGNRFDLALFGEGFFCYNAPSEVQYSRAGSLVINEKGELTDHQGNQLLDINDKPIVVGNRNFAVTETGEVYFYEGEKSEYVTKIKLVRFPEKHGLRKNGENFYRKTDGSGEPEIVNGNKILIKQRYIEKSNVNIVQSMVRMIEANRAYQSNQKTIQTHDSMIGKAINEVGK